MVPTHQHTKAGLTAHVPPRAQGTPQASPPSNSCFLTVHTPPPPPRQATCSSSSLHRHQEGQRLPPGGWKAITPPPSGILLSQTRWSWGSRRHWLPKAQTGAARTTHPQGGPSSALQSSADPSTGRRTLLGPRLGPCTWLSNTEPGTPMATTAVAVTRSLEEQKGHPEDPGEESAETAGSLHRAWGGGHPTQSRATFLRWPGPF